MQKIPLLALGIGCCAVGGIGLLLLVAYHLGNYGWLVGNIFIPGTSSGLALISTLVNLYGSGEPVHYGATTTVTLAVTGGCTVICGFLAVVFTALKVRAMRRHERRWRNAEKKRRRWNGRNAGFSSPVATPP